MNFRNVSIIAAVALVAPLAVSANNVVYSTSFEQAQGFTANTYNATPSTPVNVGDWVLRDGTAVVEAGTTPDTTSQLVTLSAGAQFDKTLSSIVPADLPNGVFLEGYFRGEGSSLELKDANYPTDTPASAILHFSDIKGIQAYDGAKAGDERYITLDVPLDNSTWHKITLYLDFSESGKFWNVWVDDVLEGEALGFRDNVTRLNGFRNLAEFPSGFDAFRVVLPVLGDANGDASVDAADVVRLVEFETNPTSDPILAFNTAGMTAAQLAADILTP